MSGPRTAGMNSVCAGIGQRLYVSSAHLSGGVHDVLRSLARRRGCFLLDSSASCSGLGRYSFAGAEPAAELRTWDTQGEVRRGGNVETLVGNPFELMREFLGRFAADVRDPRTPFPAGYVGYLSYDLGRFLERLPRTVTVDHRFPELRLAFYDKVLTFDCDSQEWFVSALGATESEAKEKAEELLCWAEAPQVERVPAPRSGPLKSNFDRDSYLEAVERTIEYIAAGDIFQANISQRFECEWDAGALELYSRLRQINPAPFSAYIPLCDGCGNDVRTAVVSSSPERFLKLDRRLVQTRPIKGTRPRGHTAEEDQRLAKELLASAKDHAELAMIVDLERNDIGKVCEYGSVRVTDPAVLEEHPTVFHLVATVEGRLREGLGPVDLLEASFPGGSITGAPKIRAMEIIDELEPTARAVYTGSVCVIAANGYMDSSIVIRTVLLDGTRATLQVGGGIVADSVPEDEYEETITKAKALFAALGREPGE